MAKVRAKSGSSLVWSDTTAWQYYDGANWVDYNNIPTISDEVWLNGQAVITNATTTDITFLRLMNVITGTGNIPPGTGTVTAGTLTINTTASTTMNVTGDSNNGAFSNGTNLLINITNTATKTINFINVPLNNTGVASQVIQISGNNTTVNYIRNTGVSGSPSMFTTSGGNCIYAGTGTANNLTIGSASPNQINIGASNHVAIGGSVLSTCTINGNITATTAIAFYPSTITTSLTINGNITGGSASNIYGLNLTNVGGASISITGNITGGTNSTAYGIYANPTSITTSNFTITGNLSANTASAINFISSTWTITNFSIIGAVTSSGSVAAMLNASNITNFNITNATITGGTHTTPILGTTSTACNLIVDTVIANITNAPIFTISATTTGSTNQITYKNTCALNNGSTDSAVTPFGIANGRIVASNGCTFKYKNSNVPTSGTDPLTFAVSATPPTLLDKKWVASTAPQFTDNTNTLTYGTLLVPSPANVLKDNVYGVGVTADPSSGNTNRSVGTLDIPNAVAQVVGNIVANLT